MYLGFVHIANALVANSVRNGEMERDAAKSGETNVLRVFVDVVEKDRVTRDGICERALISP